MSGRHGRRRGWLARALRALAMIALAIVAAVAGLRWLPPPTTSFMVQYRIAAWGDPTRAPLRHRWVPWRALSPHVALAVIASEDQKFPTHHGFDLAAIEAVVARSEGGARLRGASTISQQVAKNLFLWPGRSLVRKGLEAALTVLLETLWPKRRILEVYLNVAEFGPGVFGVGAASEAFFGRPPAALGPEEAARLAAVLPDPLRLRPTSGSARVEQRARWIREQMRQLGGLRYLERL